MRFQKINLVNFRSYSSASFDIGGHAFVVLTGANGVGKTNLLEALSFLTAGSGFRKTKLSQIGKLYANASLPWEVKASVIVKDIYYDLKTYYRPAEVERRIIEIDDKKVAQKELLELSKIMWITPIMDKVFVEGVQGQRRLIDRLTAAFDPEHLNRLSDYNKVFKDRNLILEGKSLKRDPNWMEALEDQLCSIGISIAAARLEFIAQLNRLFTETKMAFPSLHISLDGFLENRLQEQSALIAEDEYKAYLKEQRNDPYRGVDGIHKTIVNVVHQGKKMPAEMCSTGEQKTLLFSLLIGSAQLQKQLRGYAPVLLLDEVVAHLDTKHRQALFNELEKLGAQTFMTGVYKGDFNDLADRDTYFLELGHGS